MEDGSTSPIVSRRGARSSRRGQSWRPQHNQGAFFIPRDIVRGNVPEAAHARVVPRQIERTVPQNLGIEALGSHEPVAFSRQDVRSSSQEVSQRHSFISEHDVQNVGSPLEGHSSQNRSDRGRRNARMEDRRGFLQNTRSTHSEHTDTYHGPMMNSSMEVRFQNFDETLSNMQVFSEELGEDFNWRSSSYQRSTVSGRQQWRPTSSQVTRGNSDRQFPSSNNTGSVPQGTAETSRGAVEQVLQSLSLRKDQGDALNGSMGTQRHKNNRKQSRSSTQILLKGQSQVASDAIQNDKFNIPQLVQELEQKLTKGQVECMICYDVVRREAAVWSCGGCYAIFHIACIRRWARAPISADFSLSSMNEVSVGNWRCPGCQSPQFVSADEIKYRCFCGQMLEPQLDYYLTPHSCGGPCKKPLSSTKTPHCKHLCTLQCHPGPCPPCNALAPPQFCSCGKTSYTQRCSELKTAKTCGQICGHQLQCGRHYCDKVCHEGPCGPCMTFITVNCFCGRRRETMACGDMSLQGQFDRESGVFSCESPCTNTLQCGKHSCNKKCHPGQCGECELAPGKVRTCPCGKVSIQELLGVGKQRQSCTDAVPRCGHICGKLLSCGKHTCQSLCHTGNCPDCEVMVDQKCRCKSSSQTMVCHKTLVLERGTLTDESDGGMFLCNRKCGKKKSCGRHRCNNRCCPLTNDDNVPGQDDPHLCSLVCGKKLRCGQHICEELCHNGHCPPCLGSTFTELSCACGKTSIPPPVPCGTFPPSCPHPCSQPQPCGHAATHQCHFGECPPCIVLTAKECVGGHVTLRNVPCGSRDIKCNKLCGKPRKCRLHACARLCHLPPCDVEPDADVDNIMSCGQQCGAPRRDCQHVCVALCHPGAPCPETRCKFPVTIMCSCGRLSQQVPCDAGDSVKGSDMLELAYISSLSLQPVDPKAKVPLGQRKLACDEECAKWEKRRVLADAFGMTGVPTDPALSAESVQAASEALKELLIRDPLWILGIEDRFKYLVLGAKSSTTSIRVHVFGFLPMEKREVIRQMAERWNFTVNKVGREPKRFLVVHINQKSRVPNSRMLFGKSALPLSGQAQAPAFNPSLDMDPRYVVALFDLPREGDISTLVLRFGGECELVWLNDKNALAVFFDMARATTAIRRVDHASAYTGAVKTSFTAASSSVRGWGPTDGGTTSKFLSRKKNIQESSWSEDAWGEEWGRSQAKPVLDIKSPAIATSMNLWTTLAQDEAGTSTQASVPDKSMSSSMMTPSSSQHVVKGPLPSADAENWEDLDS